MDILWNTFNVAGICLSLFLIIFSVHMIVRERKQIRHLLTSGEKMPPWYTNATLKVSATRLLVSASSSHYTKTTEAYPTRIYKYGETIMDLSGNSFQDLEHTQTLLTYTGHRLGVLSLAWSPDSTWIASAGKDATLQVWNATTGETLLSCSGHEGCSDYENWIRSVGWSPDGLHILSAGSDATVRLWDARTGEALLVYRGHEGPVFGRPYMVGSPPVYAAVWSPDSSRIASTSYGGTIRIWEALTGRDIVVRETLNQYIYALAWSPDGTTLAFTKWVLHEGVELWHPDSSDPSSIYRGHHYAIDDLAWSPDGVFIVSGGNGEAAQVWKSTTHELITTYCAEQPSGTGSVDWRPGGHHIASAVGDPDASLVEIWDAWTGIRCATYRGHTGKVADVAWSPDGTRVASASEDCTVQVWSPQLEKA